MADAEDLAAATDHVPDDELAAKIAVHRDRDVLLALWSRIRGLEALEAPEAEPEAPVREG